MWKRSHPEKRVQKEFLSSFFLVFEAGFHVAWTGVNSSCSWGRSSMILLPQPSKYWNSTTSSFMKCQRSTLSVAHSRQEVCWYSHIPAQNLFLFLSIMPSQGRALGRRWYSSVHSILMTLSFTTGPDSQRLSNLYITTLRAELWAQALGQYIQTMSIPSKKIIL